MTRYEPHCDCLGGHVSMLPDPNGRWCRATDPHPVADDPSGIVQQMPEGGDDALKPCPFCGAPAEIVHIDEGELAGGSCVTCTRCLACSNVEFEFKENFVSNWNHRAIEADLRAEVERLRCMIDRAAEILSNCSVESGVCCCGDAMDNHTAPMHSGHSPVDQGSYITDEWLKSYRALSPETDGGQDG